MYAFYLSSACQNLKELLKQAGLRSVLKKLTFSHHKEIIQVIHLDKLPNIAFNNILEIREVKADDVLRLSEFRAANDIAPGNPSAELIQYLNHGCKGVLAELNGEIIGYSWWGDIHSNYSFDPIGFMFYINTIGLGEYDAYGFDYFIAPKFRGRGNALEFIIKFLLSVKQLGYKKLYGFVNRENLAARWIYQVMGYKTVMQVDIIRLFNVFVFKNGKYYFDRAGLNWLFSPNEASQGTSIRH